MQRKTIFLKYIEESTKKKKTVGCFAKSFAPSELISFRLISWLKIISNGVEIK